MADITTTVAANLRRYRRLSGRSMTWLADTAGMSKTNLVNIEAGRTATSIMSLAALADALGVKPADLVTESDLCPLCGQTLPASASDPADRSVSVAEIPPC